MCGLEHLANCHGEWAFFGAGITTASGILLMLRTKFKTVSPRVWFKSLFKKN